MSDVLRMQSYGRYVVASDTGWLLRAIKNAVCYAIVSNVPAECIPADLHSDVEDIGEYHLSLLTNHAFEDSFTYAACTLYLYPSMLRYTLSNDMAPSSIITVEVIRDDESCRLDDCDERHFDVRVSVSS